MRHPFGSNCLVKNECDIKKIERTANAVVTRVRRDVAQGFRNLDRRVFNRESGILSTAVPSTGGTVMKVDCKTLFGSNEPFRASVGFQFVLLGLRLLAVTDLFSVLLRLSSPCIVSFAAGVDCCCNFANSSDLDLSFPLTESGNEAKVVSTATVGEAKSSSMSSAEDPEDRLRI